MKIVRLLLPFSAAAFFAAGCTKHESTVVTRPYLLPAQVRVAKVESRDLPATTVVTGIVRPVRRATVAAKVMGTITAMPATLGQAVK